MHYSVFYKRFYKRYFLFNNWRLLLDLNETAKFVNTIEKGKFKFQIFGDFFFKYLKLLIYKVK